MGEKGSVEGWSDKKLQRKEDKNLRKQRRMEEKLYKQKKRDDMTPEERIAAKQKTLGEIGKGLEYFGQSETFKEGAPSYLDYELRQERVDLANRRADSQELEKSDTYADPYDVGAGEGQKQSYAEFLKANFMEGDDETHKQWLKSQQA